jgi:hypothetical protein
MTTNRTGENLLKHGAYSTKLLLPGESKQEYDALWQSLVDEWSPQGVTEEANVRGLLHWIWVERRILHQLNSIAELHTTRSKELETLASKVEAVGSIDEFLELWRATPQLPTLNLAAKSRGDLDALKKEFIAQARAQAEETAPKAGSVVTDELEALFRLLERFQTNISRQIKNLVMTKGMKQTLPAAHRHCASVPSQPKALAPPL